MRYRVLQEFFPESPRNRNVGGIAQWVCGPSAIEVVTADAWAPFLARLRLRVEETSALRAEPPPVDTAGACTLDPLPGLGSAALVTALGLIHGLGSIGPFTSRAFLPAFVTAALLRFGPELPLLRDLGILQAGAGAPGWFTSDASLWILGALSLLEIVATRSGEVRDVLVDAEAWIKGGMAALAQAGVIAATDEAFARGALEASALDWLAVVPAGAGTYFAARARSGVVQTLDDADTDDSLGLAGILQWAEDFWAAGGAILLLLFPIVMLVFTGLVLAAIFGLQQIAARRERRSLFPCPVCGAETWRCGLTCPNRHPVEAPADVGLLGNCVDRPARSGHAFHLLEKRRCPRCATRLGKSRPGVRCTGCDLALLTELPTVRDYVRHLDRKLPVVLVGSALLGAVPVLGLVPGIVYYRFALVAPLAGYVPTGTRVATRFALRVALVILLAFQWVPGLGAAVVPLMALLSYGFYRRAFTS